MTADPSVPPTPEPAEPFLFPPVIEPARPPALSLSAEELAEGVRLLSTVTAVAEEHKAAGHSFDACPLAEANAKLDGWLSDHARTLLAAAVQERALREALVSAREGFVTMPHVMTSHGQQSFSQRHVGYIDAALNPETSDD